MAKPDGVISLADVVQNNAAPKKRIQDEDGTISLAGLLSTDQFGGEKAPEETTILGEIPKGLEAGVQQVNGMVYGLAALTGTAVGSDSLTKWGAEGLAEVEAATPKPAVASYSDINDISDLGKYLSYGIATNLPNMALSFTGGGIGAVVGKKLLTNVAEAAVQRAIAGGASKEIALMAGKKIIDQAITKGAMAGAATSSIGMEAGSIAGDQLTETGEVSPGMAIAGAIPAGLLDVVPEWYLVKRLGWLGKGAVEFQGNRLVRAAKVAGQQFLMEAPTEATQSVIERSAVPGKSISNAEAWDEYINSFVLGGMTGATVGGGAGLFTKTGTKADSKKEATLIHNLATGGDLKTVDTADLDAVIKQAESITSPTSDLTQSIEVLRAERATRPKVSDVPDIQPSAEISPTPSNLSPAEQKKAVIDGFWADLNAPKGMTITEAMEAKRVILQHAPHLEDDINKAIIEAEGNKLFVPEREEVKTQNEDDISDEEYAANERAKTEEKRISETNKLSTFLRDEGVLVDSFLANPNNHITYVGKDKNGIYEVRVEEHTEQTVKPTLVTLKKGEDLTDALNKTINPITGTTNLSGQEGIVQPGATSQEAAGTQTGQGIAKGETPRPDSIGQLKADMAKTKDALAGQAQEEFKTSEDVQKAIDNFEDELIKKYGSDAVVKAPLDNKSYTKMGILPPETPLNKNELSRLQGLYAARDKIDAEDLGVWRKAVIEKSGMTEKDTHDALNALHMNVGSQTDVYFTADRLKKWGTGTTGNLKRLYDHFSKDTMADFRIGGTAENPAIQGTVYNREDGRPSTWDKESLKKTEKFFNVIAETQSASPITLSDMGKNKLPAPLSQTDAATVGIAKDEAKSGESLSDIPKIDANHQKDVIKATIRNLREGLKRKESGQYIAKQGSIDGLYDRLKYSISDLRKQGDLDHETIRAIGESGLYDEKYLKEVLPEYEPAPSKKAGTAKVKGTEKEPWEMTVGEFQSKIRGKLTSGHKGDNPETWDKWLKDIGYRPEDKDTGYSRHTEIVEQAIAEGKPIPADVLKEYKDRDIEEVDDDTPKTKQAKRTSGTTKKEEPKKNIMENAPPGGWTEADKVPEKYRKKAESSKPTVLQGTYTSHGDSMKDIRENGSNTPERKFKADLKAYAKRLQEILGYEPNINTKGKKSTDETVSTNIAPAGGEGHIVLWKPNSDHGIYMTIMVQRDGGNDYAGNFGNDKITIGGSYSDIMYRVATKTDKYGVRGGANQWAKADVSAEELAEKIRNEVDFYENVNGAKEVIKEARHGGNTREEISKAFAEGEAAGEIEGADLTDEQIKSEIADISETLGVEVKLKEESDLSSKSTKELVDDIFSIINDHIGERGSISNKPVELDESLYQKLKPYLMEIVNRAKAKALDARAYLFGAVDSMPEGKAKEVYEAAANRYINDGAPADIKITPKEREVLDSFYEGKKTAAELGEKQNLTLTGGPAGAGKSTTIPKETTLNHVHANADLIREKVGKVTPEAHERASELAKYLKDEAITKGYHTLYDSQLSNLPLANEAINQILGTGGEVTVGFTDIDAETSIVRSEIREQEIKEGLAKGTQRAVPRNVSVKGYNRSLPTFMTLYRLYKDHPSVNFVAVDNNVDFRQSVKIFSKIDGELTIYDQNLFDKLNNIEYIKYGEGGNARYERKGSITEKDLDTTQINQRKDSLITAKRDAFREKRAEEAKGEISHEYPTDGSTGKGTLESDESGSLSANGRGRSPGNVQRGGGQINNEGNGSADVDWDVGAGSLAGEPSPIHLQDREPDSGIVPAGSGRDRQGDSSPAVEDDNATPASEPRTIRLSGVNPGNYRITEQDDIGSGTRGQRIDRNLAAIRLVKQLIKDHRYPTKEEQSVLAKYVGWGGLKTVFDGSSSKPQDLKANEELKSLLTKEEYFEARQSILNAHYTSRQVIQSIYKIMRHFGFTGGNILEPTYGVGNFLGFMPDDMAASSKWYGSELDPITSKIGQFLYPDSQLIHSGFQTAEFPYGKFDAAVGNPPFGDVRIADTRKDRSDINRMKIHNYVISKSGMHLKPGGIMGMVITNRFLDTADPEARSFLAKQFKFLGAIRLPNDAFAKTAGTEVTTDVVFFQRLMPDEKPDMAADWLTTGATMTSENGETITLNKYFAEHPELMLGIPSMKGTMYGGAWKEGGKGEFTLNKREGVDIEEAIDKVITEQFVDLKDVAKNNNDMLDAAALSLVPNKEDVAVGGFFMDKDRIYMREDNDEYGNPVYSRLTPKTKWTEKQLLGETRYNRIKGMLEIRAKAYQLINAERFDLPGIEKFRKELNHLYNTFVKEHGFISEGANYSLMSDDIKIEFGLETDFKKEITRAKAKVLGVKPSPASAEKATILKERMFFPEKEILYAKDPADGYNISLSQKGNLDIDYIVKLTGSPRESVINELSEEGLIFQDPETKEWIQEDEYLSGNVKEKYKKVENKDGFEKNAAALKKVLPPDVATEEIFVSTGATWVPKRIYEQFGHFMGIQGPNVSIYKQNGQVVMSGQSVTQNDINVNWLNPYYSLSDLFNASANNKMLIAWDGTGDDRVQNREQTKLLGKIIKEVRSTFSDWVFADETRAKELTKIYNDTQNTHAKRKFSGSHLNPVGATPSIILRNTQRDAAWRIIQSKKVLLDHCVGAGKTYTIITGVQERVRMGLTKKAMIVVPNHLVGQWAADYMRLYPGARILAATKKDFSKPNRRRLFARIATGKYDAIIVGHSSFGFIPLEPEALTNLIQEEIGQLEAAHRQAEADGNKRLIKSLANRIAKKREKINELLGRPRDNVTTFEAMGVDHLVVDESHEFKNLEYSSAMQNITGMGTPLGSKRAFDLYSKIRWLTSQPDYALNFATGTPISNSLVEMYALLRYMNRETLVSRGLEAFDSWANNYASIESKIEYTASQKLKERTVMSTFNNLPEMLQMYEEFADIVTLTDLKRIYAEQIRERNARTGGNESEDFPIPKIKDNGRSLDVSDPSPEQEEFVDYLVARAERLEEEGRNNDPKVDNHLWIMSDARKMALDIRLVDPKAKEDPNNKINRASRRIKEIYDRTKKDKGAQLVFCDLSTPAKTAQKGAATFISNALKKARLDGDARTNAILNSLPSYHEKWGYIRNKIEAEIEAISEHRLAETDQYMKRREELEEYLEGVTDDIVAHLTTADTGFSVYDEMKSKLIMLGIPEGEIKFIHDANTDPQKQELFDLVNAGQVRVLIGSSQKMGAGMNVQERLVALHHMDAPWRPSDVEQREGRLVRQGNKLYLMNPKGFLVEIKAYSTANTFDAVMWQILARKGGMLDDFRNGRRSVTEVSSDSSDYSDFMAQSTGNPAFKEKFELENEIEILEATKKKTATRLRAAQQSLNYNKDRIVEVQREAEKRDKIVNDLKDQSTFTYEGKEYKDNAKDLIGKAKDEINEHNRKVNNEYQKALEDAINKAFEEKYKNTGWDGAWIIPRYPNADVNSQEMRDYKEAYASYQLFMENEDNKKILADAIKGVKKPLNKHFHADKLAKTDKSGVIAAGLKMVDEINGLDDKESITFMLGSTEIKIKKEESGWTDKDNDKAVQLWDFVITADGMFLDRIQHDKSFDESYIWNVLNVSNISSKMTAIKNDALDYIKRMEESDKVSRHTLKAVAFKDDDKLQKMKSRYLVVLAEVQRAEEEISDRRAATGNKYVGNDRNRFPAGIWQPQNRRAEVVETPAKEVAIDENIESIKAKRDKIKKDFNDYNLDATEIADQLYKKSYASLTYKETVQVQDTIAFKHAELARYEAILSQRNNGNINKAQDNLDKAQDIWNEWHEGEDYPNEIKLAQQVINSIRSGQQRLFKGAQYSRGMNESGQSLTIDELEQHAKQLMGHAKNKPELIVVEKVSDLPFEAFEDAKGILYDGKMYLVAEQIATTEDANEVIFHELVGHFGLRGFFGDTLNSALDKIHVNNPRIRQYTNEWMKSNRDFQKQHNLSDLDYHYRAIEEAMARMAQENRPFTLARRLLHTVQTLLRKIGMTRLADMLEAKSDAEAMTMLHQARLFIDKGKTLVGSSQGQGIYYSRAQADPPVSRDPKVLNLYLKDETDALVQTIMNKLHPKRMTWLETMLKSPEWFGNPQIKNIVRLFMRDRNEIYHETFNDLNMTDDVNAPESTVTEAAKALKNKGLTLAERIAGKVSPEYQRLQEIIDEGDTTWKRDTSKPLDEQIKKFEDHIRQQGATEDTIRVWKLYRQSYDKALDLQTAQLRQMIDELTEEANFRGEKPDLDELNQTLKGALAQMEEWKGFYAPRVREAGNWKVQAYKEHGPMRENREWYREHRGSELAARRLAQKLQREGWTIYNVGEVERIPETIYQDVNAVATAKLIDSALEKLSQKSELSNELTLKFNEEVLREVSNAIKARGFRSTMIHRGRGVVRGFLEDPIQRHLQYTNSLSGGISKARVARMAMKELLGEKIQGQQVGGIDPVNHPKEFQVAQDYIQEQLRNTEPIDRMIGIAKSIATFKFLGFNLRSLAVNTTAVVTTAPAAIHQYALSGKGSITGIMRELAVAGKDYGTVMAGKKLENADEQAFLDEVHRKGWDDAQYTREALGELSKTHSRIWSSMMDGSMYLFGKSERWNRGTTMLAAYRVARKRGMSHNQAAEVAKEASDKAHGVYGKATMPMWAQGNNPAAKVGQMMYVYGKFSHNYLQMLYDMGLKKHNIKGAMFAFLSPLVLAGGTALPFKDTIFAFAGVILRSLFGEDKDPEKWVWDIIRQHLGEDAERIGRHGLTGAAGVDISGSLSIGVGIPKNMIELTGAIGGVAVELKEAVENIGRGRYVKAVEHILPSGLANPVRAIRESNEGVSTRNNRRVWDTSGKPYQPSVGETISRAAGFRSTRQAVISERTWEGHREQARYNDARNALYERYRAWLLGGRDPEEHKAITKKVREYNNGIKEVDGVSRITFESLRRQAKGLKKPAKRERAILAN